VELKWYIVHTYSGFENKVSEPRGEDQNLGSGELFRKILVPTEKVVSSESLKKTSSRVLSGTLCSDGSEREDLAHREEYGQVTGLSEAHHAVTGPG